jgi:hypothetical protein
MATEAAPGFNQDQINQALEAARAYSAELQAATEKNLGTPGARLEDGALAVAAAECISVTVQNGKVCVTLPLGIGQVCLPVPSWVPSGTVAKACITICTKWGIPCGVELTISVAGQVIIKKGFGCSC